METPRFYFLLIGGKDMQAKTISLSDAALRLGVGYAAARDMLLRRELRGGKDARGRYVVEAADLERVLQERERDKAPAA